MLKQPKKFRLKTVDMPPIITSTDKLEIDFILKELIKTKIVSDEWERYNELMFEVFFNMLMGSSHKQAAAAIGFSSKSFKNYFSKAIEQGERWREVLFCISSELAQDGYLSQKINYRHEHNDHIAHAAKHLKIKQKATNEYLASLFGMSRSCFEKNYREDLNDAKKR